MHRLIGLILILYGLTAMFTASFWFTGRCGEKELTDGQRRAMLLATIVLLVVSCGVIVVEFPNGL